MSNEGPKDLVDGASDLAMTALTAAASSGAGSGSDSNGAGSGSDSNGAGSGSDSNGVGLRQMLLTILAPTLALVGIGIGVWDSSRQEASARQREDQVRRATLVLPYYDKVITAQDEVDAARTKCDTAWELWFETDSYSPEEKAAEAEAEAEAVCVEVTSSFTKLNSALNQALLVSNEELEPVVADYKKAQSDYQSLWDGEGGATPECFPVSSEDPDFDGLSEEEFNDMSEAQFNDMSDEDLNAVLECQQTAFEDAIEDAKSTLDGLRDKMTDVVQDQVLLDQDG